MSDFRAATYSCVSTDSQAKGDKTSLDDQEARCRDAAERYSWTVVGTYQDAGVSGAHTDRSGLARLLADARARKINLLIVGSQSRPPGQDPGSTVADQGRADGVQCAGVLGLRSDHASAPIRFRPSLF